MGTNWLGNTEVVSRTKVSSLWEFPELKQRKAGRVVTKHFANLTYCLEHKYLSFLSFLIYQAGADNSIQYTSKIHEQYGKAIELARKRFGGGDPKLATSHPKVRNIMVYLIEHGLLLPTVDKAKYLINPNLSYNRTFISKVYFDEFIVKYEYIREQPKELIDSLIQDLTSDYIKHVEQEFGRHHKSATKEQ